MRSRVEIEQRRNLIVERAGQLRRQSKFARARPEHSAEMIVSLEEEADVLMAKAQILSWVLAENGEAS